MPKDKVSAKKVDVGKMRTWYRRVNWMSVSSNRDLPRRDIRIKLESFHYLELC